MRTTSRQLLLDGRPAPLGGRAFDVLHLLVENSDRVVTKDELLERVWPGLAVEPNNLQVQVCVLRKLLGAATIATVARRGYQLTLRAQPLERSPVDPERPIATAMPPPIDPRNDLPTGAPMALPALTADVLRHRLVTLCGGTRGDRRRLAVAAMQQLRNLLPGGAWQIEAAAPDHPALGQLLRRLARFEAVLVLHDAADLPDHVRAAVLAARAVAPGVRVIATAQQPLGLPDEQVHQPAKVDLGRRAAVQLPVLRWQPRAGRTA